MKQSEMQEFMTFIFDRCQKLRGAGQKEYAHEEDNAFRNFESVAKQLGTSREKVLLTYFLKHIDGIISHVNGHTSQREHVSGRIEDAIVYLCLLYGMTSREVWLKEQIAQKNAKRLVNDTFKMMGLENEN